MIDVKKLGETRVTVPLALLAGLFWLGLNARELTIGSLDQVFFTDAAAGELTKAVERNTDALTAFIRRQEIRDVNEQLDDVAAQITATELWIAANGANAIASARMVELINRKSKLEEKRSCLLNASIENKELCDVY